MKEDKVFVRKKKWLNYFGQSKKEVDSTTLGGGSSKFNTVKLFFYILKKF